jgi:ribulose bisphosphate carboxylase small subunit
MEKYSIKQLKDLVKQGIATDVTYAHKRTDIPESYWKEIQTINLTLRYRHDGQ